MKGYFSLRHRVQIGSGARQAFCPIGTRGFFPGSEADYSFPSSGEVKRAWSYTYTPQYVFIPWYVLKHRDRLTFTFHYRLCQHGDSANFRCGSDPKS